MNDPIIIGDATLYRGDALEILPTLEAVSVDSVVTDSPYGLGFMGKDWDHGVPGVHFWAEILRVAKPGAYLLAFGGTRTFHRLACAIEDAGWEIRDCVMWVYGSGFPKSLDVSKAIDKAAGIWRGRAGAVVSKNLAMSAPNYKRSDKGLPATDAAKRWAGWGTALKPAWEPIIVARKPLEGTVAANVQKHGTGGMNIDGCRVGTEAAGWNGGCGFRHTHEASKHGGLGAGEPRPTIGRWPANVVHDGSEEVVGLFPQTQGGTWNRTDGARPFNNDGEPTHYQTSGSDKTRGSAARFFYCAKASKKDRDEGLEGMEKRRVESDFRQGGAANPRAEGRYAIMHNHHPTVKPTALMRWLVRLVTPPGGIVLDPFMGSGSTGKACAMEGFRFVGIELDPGYFDIACRRIEDAMTGGPLLAEGKADG